MDVFSPNTKQSIAFDVVVAGSGSAGATAAIAAARTGAKTLLVERFGFLGGTSTAVLDTFYGFYTPGSRSLKVVGGIADDVVKGLREYDACMERPNTYGAGTGITVKTPLRIDAVPWDHGTRAWKVNGKPADCVTGGQGIEQPLQGKPLHIRLQP